MNKGIHLKSSTFFFPPDLHDSQILMFKCVFKAIDVIGEEGGWAEQILDLDPLLVCLFLIVRLLYSDRM